MLGYMSNLYIANYLKAELTALRQGLQLALPNSFIPLEISKHYKETITFIIYNHPSCDNILHDCRDDISTQAYE